MKMVNYSRVLFQVAFPPLQLLSNCQEDFDSQRSTSGSIRSLEIAGNFYKTTIYVA